MGTSVPELRRSQIRERNYALGVTTERTASETALRSERDPFAERDSTRSAPDDLRNLARASRLLMFRAIAANVYTSRCIANANFAGKILRLEMVLIDRPTC